MAAFSPRRRPQLAATCVDVQWIFLPPQPARHGATVSNPPPRSPVRVADALESSRACDELHQEQLRLRALKETEQIQEHQVLYDLMGETQRQAMLNKVMADMEAMTFSVEPCIASQRVPREGAKAPLPGPGSRRPTKMPTKPRPAGVDLLLQGRLSAQRREQDIDTMWSCASVPDGGADDGGDLSDEDGGIAMDDIPELQMIRERHRLRLAGKLPADAERHCELNIRWQKTNQAQLAIDLPRALVRGHEDCGDCEHDTTHQDQPCDLFPVSEEFERERRSRQRTTVKAYPIQASDRLAVHTCQRSIEIQSPRASRRVRHEHYGSWYVPRNEWWQLHQTKQDQPRSVVRHVCELESPNQRPGKEPMVRQSTHPSDWPSLLRTPSPVSYSPRPSAIIRPSISCQPSAPSYSTRSPRNLSLCPPPTSSCVSPRGRTNSGLGSPRVSSVPPAALAPDAIALRAAVLQNEIPQAFIAREYRNYLIAKGARVPSYLNHDG